MNFRYKTFALMVAIVISLFAQGASAAKLTPISRGKANSAIAICKSTAGHFILRHGNWTACCVEDANLKPSCTVCDNNGNCSSYEGFKSKRDVFNRMKHKSSSALAPKKQKYNPKVKWQSNIKAKNRVQRVQRYTPIN